MVASQMNLFGGRLLAQVEARFKRENDLKAAMVAKVRALQRKVVAETLKLVARLALADPEKCLRNDVANIAAGSCASSKAPPSIRGSTSEVLRRPQTDRHCGR